MMQDACICTCVYVASILSKNISRHDIRAWLGCGLWPHQSFWAPSFPTSKGGSILKACRADMPKCAELCRGGKGKACEILGKTQPIQVDNVPVRTCRGKKKQVQKG